MSKYLKTLLVVYGVITILFGLPLLLAPGRFLGVFGWAPVDPLLSRLLGAALLAQAWGCISNWQAQAHAQVRPLMEMAIVFNVLGAVGFARHLFRPFSYPFMVWFVFFLMIASAVAWGVAYFKR